MSSKQGGPSPEPNSIARSRRSLVLLPQGQEELALAAEVVVQAAHARVGPLDHVGNAGTGETLLGEDRAGRVQQRALGLLGPPPLPGPAGRPGRQIVRHAAHRSVSWS